MISVISAFKNQAIQNELRRDIENHNISFMCDDCANTVMLLMEVEQNPNVDVIFIRHAERRDTDTHLEQIRSISKDVRIVLIISGLRNSMYNRSLTVIVRDITLRILSLRARDWISLKSYLL